MNFLLNALATGFTDEQIILKHEAELRAWMNIKMTMFFVAMICGALDLAGWEWIRQFRSFLTMLL